jgi:hypothetical protein
MGNKDLDCQVNGASTDGSALNVQARGSFIYPCHVKNPSYDNPGILALG